MSPPAEDFPGYPKTRELFERAALVIPGGIYGHTTPAVKVPGRVPYFAVRAEGCRYWDVEGRDYIDYMCGYGPIVLGYHHSKVDTAAEAQRAQGDCFNHPTERMVELIEHLTRLVTFASWGVLGKNGSDMTSWSIQVAREFTGRKKILKVKGAYHGTHAWCTPGHGGVIEEDRSHIHGFTWNNLEEVQELFRTHAGQIAGIIVTPYHHPVFADAVLPADGFMKSLQELCHQHGAILILDDIRAGFRLDLGGSHEAFGFEPDMVCFCKALGNGYPISAALGREELRVAASRVFLTGSYWNSAVPMAAALACLKALEEEEALPAMEKSGQLLAEGLIKLGKQYGSPVVQSGPYAVPTYRFANDPYYYRFQEFCALAAEEGLFFHPHHNWFLSAAHGPAEIDETLRRAERAFKRLPQA